MKWADYCITKVKHADDFIHISSVITSEDLGEKFGKTLELSREELIEQIRKGRSFVTITLGKTGWDKGQKVEIVKVKGGEYIKTSNDNETRDNLGVLPEF